MPRRPEARHLPPGQQPATYHLLRDAIRGWRQGSGSEATLNEERFPTSLTFPTDDSTPPCESAECGGPVPDHDLAQVLTPEPNV